MQDEQELRLSDPVLFRWTFSDMTRNDDDATKKLIECSLDVEVKDRAPWGDFDKDPYSLYHRELVTFYLCAPETDVTRGLPLTKEELGVPLASQRVLIDMACETLGAREQPRTQGTTSIIIFTNDFDPFGEGRTRYFVGPDGTQVESWEPERPTDVCLCPCGAKLEKAQESPLDAFLLHITGSNAPEVTENDFVRKALERAETSSTYPAYLWAHAFFEQTRRRAIEEGKREGYESGHADGLRKGSIDAYVTRTLNERGIRPRQLKELKEKLTSAGRSQLAERIMKNETELQRLFSEYDVYMSN